jgi:hypothetical protein
MGGWNCFGGDPLAATSKSFTVSAYSSGPGAAHNYSEWFPERLDTGDAHGTGYDIDANRHDIRGLAIHRFYCGSSDLGFGPGGHL